MGSLRPLLRFLRPHRRVLFAGAGAVGAGAVAGALAPLVVKRAVDAMRSGVSWSAIAVYAGIVVALAVVRGGFRYVQRRTIYGVSHEVEAELREELFSRLLRHPPAFFDRLATGDVMSRFTNDLGAVRMMLGPGILFGVDTVATIGLAIGFMAAIDPVLTLWALIPLPAVSLSVRWMGRRLHRRSEAAQRALAAISTTVQENLAGLRVVRAYGREESERHRFRLRSEAYVDANMRLARVRALLSPLLSFLLGTSLLILLFVGGRRVATGPTTIGDFVAFVMYLGMIGWPLIAVGWITNLFQRASAAMARIAAILEAEPAIDDAATKPGSRPRTGGVAFRDVSFRYRAGRPPVFDRLDLEIPAGTILGVTGPTGGGKSTLVQLIPRLYEAGSGSVEVDGRPVAFFPLSALREAIAVAPQEPFLFSATLRENLEFGGGGGDRRLTLEEAAEIAGLADEVADFPRGWDTPVGERGVTLSGGQKQRAALARALLAEPRILILDDAFSSVDSATEKRILSRLRDYLDDRTTILVGHRVSTLRHADRIVVVDGGEIVESGTHEELVAAGGWYAELDRRQRLEAEIEET